MVSLLVILSIIHCILHQVCRLTFKLSDLGMVEMSHPICCQFYAREKKPNFLTHFWHAILLCAVDLQLLITKEAWPHTCYLNACQNQSCQPPTSSNIENWWGRDDSHNAHVTWCHLRKKTSEKDVVGIVTFDLIGLLGTNNIIAYITMAYQSLWGIVRC